jgi:ATP-dependent helicase/nuclease subunit B
MSADHGLFALPPGVDFGAEVVVGLRARLAPADPVGWADMTILASNRRMARRIEQAFAGDGPQVLPRIRAIADLALDAPVAPLPPLARRLELARLIQPLLEAPGSPHPRRALFSLADSLASLLDEMDGDDIPIGAIGALDIDDQSGHWQRASGFLAIIDQLRGDALAAGGERLLRLAVEDLCARLEMGAALPGPLVIAGSTGSRSVTRRLMRAVAGHPQGVVILPGVDPHLVAETWDILLDGGLQDHPQFRIAQVCRDVGVAPAGLVAWTAAEPANAARNRVFSLALHPAPATDSWLAHGPALGDLRLATDRVTLIEAPSPRAEAEALALGLADAARAGRKAALVTPDRDLARMVAAALDRWGIVPDDSGGVPLSQSPPGRLMRLVCNLVAPRRDGLALLSVLKHPLVHAGADRGPHALMTAALELWARRRGVPFLDRAALAAFAGEEAERQAWCNWIDSTLADWPERQRATLADWSAALRQVLEGLSSGGAAGTGTIWDQAAGRQCLHLLQSISDSAESDLVLDTLQYQSLISGFLAEGQVRDRDRGDPRVLIWGTLEARVQTADLVILAGLNEGVWPAAPDPDPWLNRQLRARLGLTPPERQTGLAAHDFQLGAAAAEVWLSRSLRSDDAPTVASRWVNRLTGLLSGLTAGEGPAALAGMRARGAAWLRRAALLDRGPPVPRATRPAPVLPLGRHPNRLSVSQIKVLVRNPYAIYARQVLRLSALPPLWNDNDPRLRGTILHKVMELFLQFPLPSDPRQAVDRLLALAAEQLEADCPWPLTRRIWLGQLRRAAQRIVEDEVRRRLLGQPGWLEAPGKAPLPDLGLRLTFKADRIDRADDGGLLIYDYKTGQTPSVKQQVAGLDRQLLIEAALAERGHFRDVPPGTVVGGGYIGLGSDEGTALPLGKIGTLQAWEDLLAILGRMAAGTHRYTARRMMEKTTQPDDYDHLSRFGEWTMGDRPHVVVLR